MYFQNDTTSKKFLYKLNAILKIFESLKKIKVCFYFFIMLKISSLRDKCIFSKIFQIRYFEQLNNFKDYSFLKFHKLHKQQIKPKSINFNLRFWKHFLECSEIFVEFFLSHNATPRFRNQQKKLGYFF